MLKSLIKKILKKNGVIIKRYPEMDHVRRMQLITTKKIDVVLDIGANSGQYASQMREYGYKNKIISFEPLKEAFQVLEASIDSDKKWEALNIAIGDKNQKSMINVAGNSYSSSILEMLPVLLDSAPESEYIGKESIQIKTLDSIFDSLCNCENKVMLKIDVQGFEKKVLDGAKKSLDRIEIIQLEMALTQLYKDEMAFVDMVNYLKNKGFEIFSLENGHFDSATGKLLQVDGIFENVGKS